MKQVTREEFYIRILDQDAILETIGDWPYTTIYKLRRGGKTLGKSVEDEDGSNTYWLTYTSALQPATAR